MAKDLTRQLSERGLIAIIRTRRSEDLLSAAEAVLDGGINVIEVPLTSPGALDAVSQAKKNLGSGVVFGAGTVLDPESARTSILAGAQFIVTPTFNPDTIAMCRRYDIPVIPGAYTPTEILNAWTAGADFVKVFPAGLAGPDFIKALRAPLPQIRLCPVGGVTLENVADFFRAGAVLAGVGGELVNDRLLADGNFDTITHRARRFCEEASLGRRSRDVARI